MYLRQKKGRPKTGLPFYMISLVFKLKVAFGRKRPKAAVMELSLPEGNSSQKP